MEAFEAEKMFLFIIVNKEVSFYHQMVLFDGSKENNYFHQPDRQRTQYLSSESQLQGGLPSWHQNIKCLLKIAAIQRRK